MCKCGKKKKVQPPTSPNLPQRVTRSSRILVDKEEMLAAEVVPDISASPKVTIWDLCKMTTEEARICRENMESESIPNVSASSTPISVRYETLLSPGFTPIYVGSGKYTSSEMGMSTPGMVQSSPLVQSGLKPDFRKTYRKSKREKAAGLKLGGNCSGTMDGLNIGTGSALGSANKGPGLLNTNDFPLLRAEGVGRSSLGSMVRPNTGSSNNLISIQPMKSMVENLRENAKGSGFFDVSKNNFGFQQNPNIETKNTFGKLQDEEECFDTEFGLWEKEMLLVRKFYATNTCPPVEVYSSWSDKMKTYYVMLTKFDPMKDAMVETNVEDEVEVELETDESARDIVRGT